MSFIETEIFPALSRAVNYVLGTTFNSPKDRDLEGLSLRVLLLNVLAEKKLCNIDINYKRVSPTKLEDVIEWENSYLKIIDGDLKKLLRSYALILEGKKIPKILTHLELNKEGIKTAVKNTYDNLDYEKIFANCNDCPVRFLCFCELKTFLACSFHGSIYAEQGSRLNDFLKSGFIERRSLAVLIRKWLRDALHEGEYTGFPYLTRNVVERLFQEKGVQVDDSRNWRDGKYAEVDPYVTMSLLQLLLDRTFTSELNLPEKLRIAKGSELYRKIMETVIDMQHKEDTDKGTMKRFILESGGFDYHEYPVYGSWDEGFWGGTKIVRVGSTADIGRILYKLEGMSEATKETIERVIEFVVMAFKSSPEDSDQDSGSYVIDRTTFRHIDTSIVSNIIGTISALRFLFSIDELRGEISTDLFLPEEVKTILGNPEEFYVKRIKWLIGQQRDDGAFPILSNGFVDAYFENVHTPTWIKDTMQDPETLDICNSSLNATVGAILLFLEYIERQRSKSPVQLKGLSAEEKEFFSKLPVERQGMIFRTLRKLDNYYSIILPEVDNEQKEHLELARENLLRGLIYKRRPISESAVNSLSKVFENSLRKQMTNRSKEKWGVKWKAESQRVLGLSKQIKDLSYGGIIHAIIQWNSRFENEPIVPHDFVKRIGFFRIVRVLSAHLKEEYDTELAAYRGSWKRDYDRFENDLIYAFDSALYMMKQQTISGDGSRTLTTIGEHASIILEGLGEIISMLKEKEFKDARRDLNRVTKAAKSFFEESPEKFAKIIQMENQAIIELLTDTEKALPEGDPNRLGCREWLERLKKDTAVVADPIGVLNFIMRIALIRAMMKRGISNRVLELLERIIGRFTGEPDTSSSESSESLSDRIPTGSENLDNLLLGGIPETYTVALTSLACDERDSLIERFLELGTKSGQIIFYVTTNVSERVLALAKTSKSNFHLFVCNPQAEMIVKDLPNAIKLKGVENLTDFNMALTSAFRKLDASPKKPRRACIGIISDVLLQHRAVQTRKWVNALIPELKTKGFTTLAPINTRAHPSHEFHAILSIFEGEINISEKATEAGLRKFLKVKKLTNRRHLDDELPL